MGHANWRGSGTTHDHIDGESKHYKSVNMIISQLQSQLQFNTQYSKYFWQGSFLMFFALQSMRNELTKIMNVHVVLQTIAILQP